MNLMLKFTAVAAVMSLFALPALAADTTSYDITIKNHKFEPATVTIPADTKVKLNVKNADATPEEFESHDLSREKIIPGNSQAVIMVGPLKKGTYKFFGEFNQATAQGQIVVQ